jgi:hypothetical protein
MKNKINEKKTCVNVSLLIAILAIVAFVSGAIFLIIKYYN